MKNITIISVNSNMFNRIEDAENRVYQVSLDKFRDKNFAIWNQDLYDRHAEQIVKNVGCASRINVKSFIGDLW